MSIEFTKQEVEALARILNGHAVHFDGLPQFVAQAEDKIRAVLRCLSKEQ